MDMQRYKALSSEDRDTFRARALIDSLMRDVYGDTLVLHADPDDGAILTPWGSRVRFNAKVGSFISRVRLRLKAKSGEIRGSSPSFARSRTYRDGLWTLSGRDIRTRTVILRENRTTGELEIARD